MNWTLKTMLAKLCHPVTLGQHATPSPALSPVHLEVLRLFSL